MTLDHFAITFQGTREQVEERALPFRPGDEVLVEIVEPHMYDVDDAVAKIDGYIISIAAAAAHVGEKRMVRIDEVGRTAATALLLDESGEVIALPEQSRTNSGRARARERRAGAEDGRAAERVRARARGRRAPADSEDAQARREAGLSSSPTAIDSEPEEAAAEAAAAEAAPAAAALAEAESGGDGAVSAQEGADLVQSKPRRRGRRGGRRRSAAKATPE